MRLLACVVMIAVLAACGGNDAQVDKLEQQVVELTRELATLRAELEARKAKAAEPHAPVEPPAPVPVPEAPPGLTPACRRYLVTVASYLGCEKIPAPARAAASKSVEAFRAEWPTAPTPGELSTASDECRRRIDVLRTGAQVMGCGMAEPAERDP